MKQDIHPNYGPAKVICACGEVWEIKSTRPEYKVGICAKCHPFFTGKQKFVDTAGRIDKFNKRYGNTNKQLNIIVQVLLCLHFLLCNNKKPKYNWTSFYL